MRRLLVIPAVAALAAFAASSAEALQPGPAVIRVTAQIVSTKTAGDATVRAFNLFNAPAYRRKVGQAVLVCQALADQFACREYLTFGRGQIVAEGLVTGVGSYRLAVTGGTGYYANTGGELVVQPLGREQQVDVALVAFG